MSKVMMLQPDSAPPPILMFLSSLDGKLQQKLDLQIRRLAFTPVSALTEPHYKHFTIAKYSRLFELRERGRALVRIIFTIQEDGTVILLEPFIKRHKRVTMQALDSSLKILARIEQRPGLLIEYESLEVLLKKEGKAI